MFEYNQRNKIKAAIDGNKIGSAAFDLNLEEEQELIEHFLQNSIESIHQNVSSLTTNQQHGGKKLSKISEILDMKKNLQVTIQVLM